MKAKYLILALASLFLIAGCSKSKTEAPVQDDEEWIYDETLPVPVNFSMPQLGISSKATAETIEDLSGKEIGVFGIKTDLFQDLTINNNPTSGPTAAGHPLTADLSSNASFIENLYNRRSVVGNGEDDAVTFRDDSNTGDLTVYYPINSDDTYSFYAYYPYNSTVTRSQEALTVSYLLGYTDILWSDDHAQSLQNNVTNGFNAEYIRTIKQRNLYGQDKYHANFNFKHLTTGLTFTAKTEEADNPVKITGLRIMGTPASAILCIAAQDANETYDSGVLVPGSEGNIAVQKGPADSSPELDIQPTTTGNPIGTLLLYPEESYSVEITLDLNGTTITDIYPLSRNGGFVAGTMYTVTINVASPERVEIISVDVAQWGTEEGGSINVG